jgi:hypothetical protein
MAWALLPVRLMSKDCAKYQGRLETMKSIYLKQVKEVFNTQERGVFDTIGKNLPNKRQKAYLTGKKVTLE